MQLDKTAGLRLKAIVESDPGALVRVLQFFQTRNLVPRHVSARRLGGQFLETEIEIDATELESAAFRGIAAKIAELPVVVAVVACD
jgi:prephenate dehydratase